MIAVNDPAASLLPTCVAYAHHDELPLTTPMCSACNLPGKPTCGHSCSCRNGRNDFAGDQLGLELVHLWDLVVACAHVSQASNEVHVEVGVHILLKHHGRQLVA